MSSGSSPTANGSPPPRHKSEAVVAEPDKGATAAAAAAAPLPPPSKTPTTAVTFSKVAPSRASPSREKGGVSTSGENEVVRNVSKTGEAKSAADTGKVGDQAAVVKAGDPLADAHNKPTRVEEAILASNDVEKKDPSPTVENGQKMRKESLVYTIQDTKTQNTTVGVLLEKEKVSHEGIAFGSSSSSSSKLKDALENMPQESSPLEQVRRHEEHKSVVEKSAINNSNVVLDASAIGNVQGNSITSPSAFVSAASKKVKEAIHPSLDAIANKPHADMDPVMATPPPDPPAHVAAPPAPPPPLPPPPPPLNDGSDLAGDADATEIATDSASGAKQKNSHLPMTVATAVQNKGIDRISRKKKELTLESTTRPVLSPTKAAAKEPKEKSATTMATEKGSVVALVDGMKTSSSSKDETAPSKTSTGTKSAPPSKDGRTVQKSFGREAKGAKIPAKDALLPSSSAAETEGAKLPAKDALLPSSSAVETEGAKLPAKDALLPSTVVAKSKTDPASVDLSKARDIVDNSLQIPGTSVANNNNNDKETNKANEAQGASSEENSGSASKPPSGPLHKNPTTSQPTSSPTKDSDSAKDHSNNKNVIILDDSDDDIMEVADRPGNPQLEAVTRKTLPTPTEQKTGAEGQPRREDVERPAAEKKRPLSVRGKTSGLVTMEDIVSGKEQRHRRVRQRVRYALGIDEMDEGKEHAAATETNDSDDDSKIMIVEIEEPSALKAHASSTKEQFVASMPGTLFEYAASEDPKAKESLRIALDALHSRDMKPSRKLISQTTLAQLERHTRTWHHTNYTPGVSVSSVRAFSLQFNECSVNSISSWAAQQPPLVPSTSVPIPRRLSTADVKFRRCGLCELWGHYEIQCSRAARKGLRLLQAKVEKATNNSDGRGYVKDSGSKEGSDDLTLVEECEGFLISQQSKPNPSFMDKEVGSSLHSKADRPPKAPLIVANNVDGFVVESSKHASALGGRANRGGPVQKGDKVAWIDAKDRLQTGMVLEVKIADKKEDGKSETQQLAYIKPFRDTDEEPIDAFWVPSVTLRIINAFFDDVSGDKRTRLESLGLAWSDDTSYYFSRLNRMKEDGTFVPKQAPARQRDGTYKAPRGRKPVGRLWDSERGIWVPAVSRKNLQKKSKSERDDVKPDSAQMDTSENGTTPCPIHNREEVLDSGTESEDTVEGSEG